MMSEKQVESWSRRGHIDSFANRVGAEGLFEEECPPCKLIDVGNAKRYVTYLAILWRSGMQSKRKEIYNEDIFEAIDSFELRISGISMKFSGDRTIDNGLFLMSYAMFEDTIRTLLKIILYAFPEKLNIKSCSISRQQICDIADKGYGLIIDNELYQLFKGGAQGQINYLISLISGINVKNFNDEITDLVSRCVEISLYRNSIIHNGSKVSNDVFTKCRFYKVNHMGELNLSTDKLDLFFKDYMRLFNYLKECSRNRFKFYSEVSRVEKLRKLWYRCFNSPIMVFEDYWEIDVEHDAIIDYKEPSAEKCISSGEEVYLSFWKNQFHSGRYKLSNFMLCSINYKIIVDILEVIEETKFYYMYQEAERIEDKRSAKYIT